MSSPAPTYVTAILRVLRDEQGEAVVEAAWREVCGKGPAAARRRRTIAQRKAAERAADLAPPDELARARARRGK